MAILPFHKLIFIDVNGTLIAEDASSGHIPLAQRQSLSQACQAARQRGFQIGLCSDSPLPELLQYAHYLELDRIMLAENGNIFFHEGQQHNLHTVPNREQHEQAICQLAVAAGYGQPVEVVAPEFDGRSLAYHQGEWGFGAHREASITVFADASFIHSLGAHFEADRRLATNLDCSPAHNYFAIHPQPCQASKGTSLAWLRQQVSEVIMIGNSLSDWAPPASQVTCGFVATADLPPEVRREAFYCSPLPLAQGVVDVVRRVLQAL